MIDRLFAAGLALLLPAGAQAESLWDVFETRCLVPYEHIALPDTRGLTESAGRWTGDGTIWLELTPDTCTAAGLSTQGALSDLLARRELAYEEVAPGVWLSDLWREPRLEVTATEQSFTARETDLES